MATFELAIPTILDHEGGFVNDVHDPGGATKYGISLRFLSRLGIRVDYDRDGDVDEKDVRTMPRQDAINFYDALFWTPGGFETIRDQQCATKLFDVAVNMGARQANRLALRACGLPDGIPWMPVDAINIAKPSTWLVAMSQEQAAFYHRIVAHRPESEGFLSGWLSRAAWPYHPAALLEGRMITTAVRPRCACLGCLQPGPTRVVEHGERECVSTPLDGGERTRILEVGRCPRCTAMRAVAGVLCRGCAYHPESRP